MIMEIISILLGILILLGFSQGEALGNMHNVAFALLDLPSLVIILVFTVPVLIRGGVWKDFTRAFLLLKNGYTCHLSELRRTQDVLEMLQKQVVYAGIMAMLLTFITIMRQLSDLASLGPNLAVAILTVLYATVIEMLLLPLHLEVKRQIINYMELDGDTEESDVTVIGSRREMHAESGKQVEMGAVKDGDAEA
ncbi:MAG: hypothetical protein K2O59_01350 [Lachnospiraceae bacterium]|nr:hypothetical protein [Lachnospiraceae bacterium]